MKLQAASIKDEGDASLGDIRTSSSIVTETVRSMGLKPGSSKEDEAEKVKAFRGAVDDRIAQEAAAKGRKLNNKEIRDIANEQAMEVTQKFFGVDFLAKDKKLFELSPDEKVQFRKDAIPPSEVAEIRADV